MSLTVCHFISLSITFPSTIKLFCDRISEIGRTRLENLKRRFKITQEFLLGICDWKNMPCKASLGFVRFGISIKLKWNVIKGA